jgi:hypothetical protein
MNMISGRKEVEELFEQLGKRLERDKSRWVQFAR